ncbi:MAG TPA: extracellular solute-binding protein, partial [Fimbriimonadaceae bacterium]|nr:extracellular solute-binding protein [Fimbriimonadaceae bacterium]
MRTTFALLFLGLGLLSALAWLAQPPAGKPGKVTIVRLSDSNNLRVAQDDLFVELNPKFDLQLDPNASGVETVIVQSMAGVGPDLFDCFDPSQLSAYVRSGIAWDITDELAKHGIDIRKDCFEGILKTTIYDGRVYGVPTNIAADGIWFHKDLFRENGIPVHKGPWKWSEFLPIAEKLTVRDRSG